MKYRSCTVVLVGTNAANRKWINHEIVKSWNDGMGVVGIHIHGLEDSDGNVSQMGRNPFEYISYGDTGKKLSSIVKCYNPDSHLRPHPPPQNDRARHRPVFHRKQSS